MTSYNPYSQAGWSYGTAGSQSSTGTFLGPCLSPDSASALDFVTFHFMSFAPNILNCIAYAPHSRPFLQITTSQNVTTLKDQAGACVAVIEWSAHPVVDIKGLVPKMYANAWLKLSHDGYSRTMAFGNDKYKWVPSGPNVCLYNMTSSSPQPAAKVSKIAEGISIGMTMEITRIPGMVHAILVASLLLQSGRNID